MGSCASVLLTASFRCIGVLCLQGFFLYSLAFFPMFVVLVIGYNRFRPSCCEIGRGQVKADQAPEKEQGGHFVVGIAPPEQAMGGKGGGGDAQLGQYAANHGY